MRPRSPAVLFLLILLWVALTIVDARPHQEPCEDKHVICPCGGPHTYTLATVKTCSREGSQCLPCNRPDVEGSICDEYAFCETCLPGLRGCYTCPLGRHGSLCRQGRNKDYPIRFYIPGDDSGRRRIERHAGTCDVPTDLAHADITCYQWFERIKCDVHCHYGQILPDKTTRKRLYCNYTNGIWYPSKWSDCRPSLNCGIELVEPGNYMCKYDMTVPPFCMVDCEESKQWPAIPRKKYICDGHWDPELPPCVKGDLWSNLRTTHG